MTTRSLGLNLRGDDPRHGTVNGYSNLKCRCFVCKQAWTEYNREQRLVRFLQLTPDDPRHGSRSTYLNYGCRCGLCRTAANTYNQTIRKARRGAGKP